jgi:hypothetical protein
MTTDELYSLFRDTVADTVKPYLWSDDEVYAYMNDAYFWFVRLTGGIPDFLSDICTIPVVKDEPNAEISQAILRIRQATLSDGRDVKIINAQDTTRLNDEDFGLLRRLNMTNTTGAVRYMVIGLEPGLVRWVNIPDHDDSVHLLIERLPLAPIDTFSSGFDGVADQHHFHFLKWMEHLAYNKHDVDSYNPRKSEDSKAKFLEYCDFAKKEKDIAKHKTRIVAYGGI